MSTSEAIRYPPELRAATIYAFRPEQRWLVTDDWVEALKRMDSLDGKTGAPPVPHLAAVRWYNYHMPTKALVTRDQILTVLFPKRNNNT